MSNIVTPNPNFTIVTSGGCNAKCSFCTDDMNRPASTEYIQNLARTLAQLPAEFQQVSITGGEPTISPDFLTVLYMIKASSRFKKVVLTTNGTKLKQYIPQLKGLVDHINISRHAVNDERNKEIFGTKRVPNEQELTEMCTELNKLGIDVTLNRVYVEPSSDDSPITLSNTIQVRHMAEFAKKVGASAVAFRHDQNTGSLEQTWVEHQMLQEGYTKINEGGCPVCRSYTHLVNGMPCMFKASMAEPGDHLAQDDIYELIYHVDGRVCTDWDGKREFDLDTSQVVTKPTQKARDLLAALTPAQFVESDASTLLRNVQRKDSLVRKTVPRPKKIKRLSKEITQLSQLPVHSCGSPYVATGQPDETGCGVPARTSCGGNGCGQTSRSGC